MLESYVTLFWSKDWKFGLQQMDVLSSSVFTMWTCNVFYFPMNSFDVFSVVVFMIRTVSTIPVRLCSNMANHCLD